MTRRASALDSIQPEPVASMHPIDLASLHIEPGETLTIQSRRGAISLYARADDGTPRGVVFVPFCYYEAAANMLTNPVLDPFGQIPEFKYCAVRVSKGGAAPTRLSFGGGVLLGVTLQGGDDVCHRTTAVRPRVQRTTVRTQIKAKFLHCVATERRHARWKQ